MDLIANKKHGSRHKKKVLELKRAIGRSHRWSFFVRVSWRYQNHRFRLKNIRLIRSVKQYPAFNSNLTLCDYGIGDVPNKSRSNVCGNRDGKSTHFW